MTIWNELQGFEFKQRFINITGTKIRTIEAGDGPLLMFLHGTGGHAEAYLRNLRAHAASFRVMALDMIGHGYSDAPDISYEMQDYVNFMAEFVDSISPNHKVYISGESLGASVAAWYAGAYPNRVAKIVLNTGTLLPPEPEGRAELLDLLDRTRNATNEVTRESIRARMQWLFFNNHELTEELVESRYRIYIQPGRAEVIRKIVENSLGALLNEADQARWYSSDLLKKIQCPTLVLWTRHNPGQGLDLAERTLDHLSAGELVVLEHSAHWPQWEEPDRFNEVHLKFLKK